MNYKLATVTIPIPYKKAGNVITQNEVSFELYKENEYYKLIPCMSEDERRIANLPDELNFKIVDDKPVSLRGTKDGNFHVIQDAVLLLQKDQRDLFR